MMTRAIAAAYCGLTEAAFEREIHAGRLPLPVKLGGKDHWHRPAVDRDLAKIAGATLDWRSESPLYAQG